MENYLEQVYAGVLGKVIGVYMGRPFEGWKCADIEKRFGEINRYVNEDLGVPLVVSDDDISGTFTFVRALEDSGRYADTPPDFFGDNWLNYLIENRTILWWGGMGTSTEHTAFLRLKHGVRAPESGSMALNGRVVSEQIGAQIFIDAFGMVAPGNPALAMRLAERAARVSHDGEAVIGAKVVAAMVSLAFVDKDIHVLLDKAIALVPQDSLIAQVHRDVRAWAREDGDWRKTFARIAAQYGYDKFGGGCHMIPNHAVMVMAWEYAGNDFFEAQRIVNSAGWDTDCNAANVGTVSALVAGLGGLAAKYDFRTPTADRVIIPTANGTDSVSDCLRIAKRIARIGCRISGIKADLDPKGPKYHDFILPGAVHGYMGETKGASATWSPLHGGSLRFAFTLSPGKPALVETPVLHDAGKFGNYAKASTPFAYHGATATVEIGGCALGGKSASACIAIRCIADEGEKTFRSPAVALADGQPATLAWRIDCGRLPVKSFGIEVSAPAECTGEIAVSSVDFTGEAEAEITQDGLFKYEPEAVPGWICTVNMVKWGACIQNEGTGLLVTGNNLWQATSASCGIDIHCGEAGLVLCYQGLKRHYAVTVGHGKLKVIRNHYGIATLFETDAPLAEDTPFLLEAAVRDGVITAKLNGETVASVRDATFSCGGAGFCLENGRARLTAPLQLRAELK